MDKISIVVPVYNCEKFIGECLDSIKQQTISNFEVVLIDDCSTDKTPDILKAFAKEDSRFVYIKNETNLQISACRNKGISSAKGDYVFFVDADDVLEINCLEKLYAALKENDADVSICGFEMFENEIAKSTSADIKIFSNSELMKEIAICDKIQNFAWGKLFKKNLFDGVVFPEGRIYEDVYVIPLVLSKANKMVFLEEKLYFYRQNTSSLSKTLNLKKIQDFFFSMEQKANLYIEKYPDYLYYLSQSFFDLFYLLKEHKIKKAKIENYRNAKCVYRKMVAKAPFKQKLKYLVAVI